MTGNIGDIIERWHSDDDLKAAIEIAVAAERERCAGTLWHCDACGTLTDTRECDCTRQGAANCLRPFTLADVQTVVAAERERCVLLLERCHTVLANMAKENEGAIFNRWPINHEPLRADARSILPDLEAAIRKGE